MTFESKSHDDKPAPAGRRSRFGRAAVAAGLAAGVALLCAAEVPASAATSAASVTPHAASASGHLTGSASEASTAAKRTVAYWTRPRMLSAANGASVSVKSAPGPHPAPAIVPGPAGRVGGTGPEEALKGPA